MGAVSDEIKKYLAGRVVEAISAETSGVNGELNKDSTSKRHQLFGDVSASFGSVEAGPRSSLVKVLAGEGTVYPSQRMTHLAAYTDEEGESVYAGKPTHPISAGERKKLSAKAGGIKEFIEDRHVVGSLERDDKISLLEREFLTSPSALSEAIIEEIERRLRLEISTSSEGVYIV